MSTAQIPTLDMDRLNAFIGQFVTDLGAAVHTGMVVIGERWGFIKPWPVADEFRGAGGKDQNR